MSERRLSQVLTRRFSRVAWTALIGYAVVVVLLFAVAAPVFADQGNMKDALGHLRAARASLERAERNKGGHRERAIEHVNAAIREVEAGAAFALGHH